MIRTSLLPMALLRVNEPVDVVLRVHNVGDQFCTNLFLEFELPQALALDHGSRKIEPRLPLGPGQWHDHPIVLRARQTGHCTIRFVSFRFRDSAGRAQRYLDRTIDIDVKPPTPRQQAPPPQPASARPARSIFINYRRDDTREQASWLAYCLNERFPRQVFLDRPSIPPGADFRCWLDTELQSCATLLALIGPQWLTLTTPTGERRIDAEDDILRYEIAVTLRRGILVIPVLFDTTMPTAEELPQDIRDLANRQAQTLDHDHFKTDFKKIVSAIRRTLRPPA
jgi:TIR domain-containing protein